MRYDALMRHPLQEIEQLRGWRGRKNTDQTIANMVRNAEESAARTHKRLGALIELWHELLPGHLITRTVLTGLHRGVLQVKVDSASTAFEIDRMLREGLEQELRSRFRGSLLRVKTRVEPLDAESAVVFPAKSVKSSRARSGSNFGARRTKR